MTILDKNDRNRPAKHQMTGHLFKTLINIQ